MNIFPKDSIPAKMLADLKNLIKRNAKFDKKTLLGLIPLLIFALGRKQNLLCIQNKRTYR